MRPCMNEVVEILRGIKNDGLGAREESEILDILLFGLVCYDDEKVNSLLIKKCNMNMVV